MHAHGPLLTEDLIRGIERLRAEYRFARLRALQESDVDVEGGEFRISSFGQALATDWKPMHRVYCLESADIEHLDALLAWFDEVQLSPHLELLPLASNKPLFDALAKRGFSMRCALSVLLHYGDLSEVNAPTEDVTIRRSPVDELNAWSDVYIDAHGWECSAAERVQWIAELHPQYAIDGITRYVAECDGKIVAIAASYHDGGAHAHLTNCATLPPHRGRGLQHALVARRLRDLTEAGATHLAADTTPCSVSHRNLERTGFRIAYQKTHWDRRSRTGYS